MLRAALTALPNESSASIGQHGNLGTLLLTSGADIDAKWSKGGGETAVQAHGTDTQAVAIRDIILPHEVATGGCDAQMGMDLIARQ